MASHTFFCIDGHTCGNPVRVVAGGGPNLQGTTMLEKRAHFLADYDWIRHGLMFEPRGHDMMSGSILYPPTREDCDVAILFIETSGCLPMCGHGTIGTVTTAIERGLVTPRVPGVLRLDTPAGLVVAEYRQEGQFVEEVKLTNVPAFLHSEGLTAEVEGLGEVVVDVAYGGNFYAIVDPQKTFRDMADHSAGDLLRWSPLLRRALNDKYQFQHPEKPEIRGLSHILWTGKPTRPEATARNAVFYGDKAIDRSPCGTGTSARIAQWAAKGKLKEGETFTHESIIGSMFKGQIVGRAEVGGKPAVIPSIAGWARVTGYNTIFIDDRDPFAHGFQVL
ncbi:4-hydroxyproline epimerase [Frigidibacter sp. SD6-1]|uniref:4-hydroxyproline epimerase n=1 Tax=Frigidibacter sp. SD6-1 TaxID=3032581 RepID=UPI0024DFC917|nr:4-hydroxyproline epimerase [Frigidibacter sp. SD6-1]